MAQRSLSPLIQLFLSRVRLFVREPAAVFWVYGFPVMMLIMLGMAFRDEPQEQITVDVVGAADDTELLRKLQADHRFKVVTDGTESWQRRLQYGKTDLVIEMSPDRSEAPYQFWEEPRRPESRLARHAVQAALAPHTSDTIAPVQKLELPGSRYIDFLVPGMLGMGLMGGGLWGVGYVVVDMRVRKLLKRFLATPMRRTDFLLSIMLSRIIFTIADVVFLLLVGYFLYGVECQGSIWELSAACLLGAASFAGIGLLVASRAQTVETVSGLMNLIILPMWVLSGVFFSSERFPEAMQPLINLLPLTALNQLLRGIMLEANSILTMWPQLVLLTCYTIFTFLIALRIFRWK